MTIVYKSAGRLILGAALLACLIAGAACGGGQAAPTDAAQGDGDSAAAVLEAYRAFGGDVMALDATTPSATVDVVNLTGTIPAYDLTGGNPPCSGFIRQAPSLVFTLGAVAPVVNVKFVGNQASNLIIVEQSEEIVCPEDAAATISPEIALADARPGQYGVWVGRIDMEKPVDGKLTVSIAP